MKYKKNKDFFKVWTEDMSYVLGMFCADGHLATTKNSMILSLHIKDKHILESICNMMEYDGVLYKRKNQDSYTLHITDKAIAQDLISFGLNRNKSQDLKWIEQIP
jgi:hypothetical protein